MVQIELAVSAKFEKMIRDTSYTTSDEDRPPREVTISGYPNIGDTIFQSDGREWTVVRVSWPINEYVPIVVVE